MAKNLMEQIAEDEKLLNQATTEEDNEQGNESGEPERPEPSAVDSEAEHEAEPKRQRGARGRKGTIGRSGAKPDADSGSQGEGEAPSEDGGTPQLDSGRTRKDGGTSPEAARGADEGRLKPKADAEKEETDAPEGPAAWARMRRELREAKAKLKEASLAPPAPKAAEPTKLDEARAAAPKKDEDPEPDRAADPEAWRDWKIRDNDRWRASVEAERKAEVAERQYRELVSAAVDELKTKETEFLKTQPDYYEAAKFGRQKYADAMRVMYPELTERQLAGQIDRKIMEQASTWATRGLNPAEEFYDLCIERFGYAPAKAAEPATAAIEEEAEELEAEDAEDKLEALANLHRGLTPDKATKPAPARPKPNLKQITATKRRSASPLHGPGQGGSISITKEAAAEMTMAEFAELSPAALADLEAMEE